MSGASKFNRTLISMSVCAAMGLPVLAQAQVIEEILVTAQKRSESISDVGMSITAMSADTLEKRQISDLDDLAGATPGLQYAPSTANTPIFTLRGIGFNESSLGVYPAVSVYLDEAPLAFPVLGSHSGYDLNHVEVLKGPQGTLFGQNSTGGAINYIAAKPTEEFAAGFDVTYGRFDLREVEGYISGPLSDTLKGRYAFKSHKMDAWQESATRDDQNGEEDYFASRAILEWQPTDSARFSLNVNGWRDKSEPQAMALSTKFIQIPGFVKQAVIDAPFPDLEPRAADWGTQYAPESDREFMQGIVRADIDLTSELVLTSLTSFADFEQEQTTDGDGSAVITYDLGTNDGDIQSFTQEIRIANDSSTSYRWVAGLNYEDSEVFENAILRYSDNSTNNPINNNIFQSGITADNSYENWAVFGNVDYFMTDRLTLKAGARYTNSEISTELCGYDAGDGQLNDLFEIISGLFGATPPTLGAGDCYTLNYDFLPGPPFQGTLEEDNVSWKLGADYSLNEDVLLYSNLSKGYKAGSFPTLAASSWSQNEPVTQESVLAFEAGFKASFPAHTLSINSAAFYYEYEDKQIKGKIFDNLFGTLDLLRNVPKSKIRGVETDINYMPIEGLTLALGATYIDSEITESPVDAVNVLSQPANFEGDPIPYTPEWQVNFNTDYEWLVGEFTTFVGMSVNYQSDSEAQLGGGRAELPDSPFNAHVQGGSKPYHIDEYTTVDLRAGITSPDYRWRVTLWGKNVTDEYYWTNVIPSSDLLGRFVGMPATYGASFSYDF